MLAPWSDGNRPVAVRFGVRVSGCQTLTKSGPKHEIEPMTQLKHPMGESETDIQKVQTAPLRRTGVEENAVIVSITKAIRAAGLGDGGSFRFVPGAVEELGMVPALGSEQEADGRSEQLTRAIYREGAGEKTLRLVIPHEALSQLTDPESIDWDDPPEVNVWAGDRLLAFEMADPEERTIQFDREAGGDGDESDG